MVRYTVGTIGCRASPAVDGELLVVAEEQQAMGCGASSARHTPNLREALAKFLSCPTVSLSPNRCHNRAREKCGCHLSMTSFSTSGVSSFYVS